MEFGRSPTFLTLAFKSYQFVALLTTNINCLGLIHKISNILESFLGILGTHVKMTSRIYFKCMTNQIFFFIENFLRVWHRVHLPRNSLWNKKPHTKAGGKSESLEEVIVDP